MKGQGRGLFIVFEGLDGAGTTTQSHLLAERVREADPDRPVLVTSEPTSGPIGSLIRQVLRERVAAVTAFGVREPFDRKALALLFAADRLDHGSCEIGPLLDAGYVVISDRYLLSSLAYQGMDAPIEWVAGINRFARPPDLLVFLDVPAKVAWERIRASRPGHELFETPETLARVAEAYQRALETCPPESLKILSGDIPREDVADRVWEAVEPLLTHP